MPTVLVVDDVSMDRVLVTGLLERNRQLSVEAVSSGVLALERLCESPPIDLVVTDLTMPEMNGLELVTAVRTQHPQVPIILATANGSESLAVSALEMGAASYVPKPQMSEKLLDTVEQVLAHKHAQSDFERLLHAMQFAELRFRLNQQNLVLNQLVTLTQQLVTSIGLCDTAEEVRLGMAFEEALRDVMLRGNFGLNDEQMSGFHRNSTEALAFVEQRAAEMPFRARHLHVGIKVNAAEARLEIRHEGEEVALPDNALLQDRTLLQRPECRAYVLMQSFLDEVVSDPDSRTLTLVKKR